ncbi:MAG: tyrosine-type recombinase/integrase [Verrucomicrobiota bacterium]
MFTDPDTADQYVATLVKERARHGRAAAVNSDEIDALRIWREFVSKEHTGGREVPALRDILKISIERLRDGATTPALESLRAQFEEAKEREAVSPRHLSALKNRLKRFVSYFDKDEPAGSVTTEAVEQAMASMRAGGLSPQSVKGTREAAHGLFSWAMKRKLVTKNPISDADAPKVIQGEVGTITPSQLKGMLLTALKRQPRAVPALAVWAFCGVRRAEINRLCFDDMDQGRKELRVSAKVGRKGRGKVRYVPMPQALLDWLAAAQSAGVAQSGKLVPGADDEKSEGVLNEWLVKARADAGITYWPNNALRHSFASYACAMTEDYPKVSAWIGHSGGTSLLEARYRHAVPKNAGATWFNVFPFDKPKAKKTAKKTSKKTRSPEKS